MKCKVIGKSNFKNYLDSISCFFALYFLFMENTHLKQKNVSCKLWRKNLLNRVRVSSGDEAKKERKEQNNRLRVAAAAPSPSGSFWKRQYESAVRTRWLGRFQIFCSDPRAGCLTLPAAAPGVRVDMCIWRWHSRSTHIPFPFFPLFSLSLPLQDHRGPITIRFEIFI